MIETTRDAFLGGKVQVLQPKVGYRAGVDPVFLAAACVAKSGDHVLELGCGVGVASLCLAARVPNLALHGVEILPEYADLARQNGLSSHQDFEVRTGDVSARPTPFYDQQFDQVIMNPPFFPKDQATSSADAGRASGRSDRLGMGQWIETAAKRLRPKGYLTMIQRAERLPEILTEVSTRLGSIRVLPLCPRQGRAAHLVLIQARKSGKAPFVLEDAILLHQGQSHGADRADYTDKIENVLRDGAPMGWAESH